MEDEDCGLSPIPNLFRSISHYPATGPNSDFNELVENGSSDVWLMDFKTL